MLVVQLASNSAFQREGVNLEKVKGTLRSVICYFLSAFRGSSSENKVVADEEIRDF